jgi:hypothetical protein
VISLFKNNQVSTSIFLLVYILLLRLPAVLGWVEAPVWVGGELGGPLFRALPDWLIQPGLPSQIAATVLVAILAFAVHNVVGQYRMTENRDWVAGMTTGLVGSLFPDLLWLSPALLAAVFLPFVFAQIMSMYKRPLAFATTFNVGFWLGISTLFYPPFLLFLAPAIFGVRLIRLYSIHERLILLVGLFVPMFLVWSWAYWFDQTELYWTALNEAVSFRWMIHIPETGSDWLRLITVAIAVLLVILSSGRFLRKQLMQTRKYISVVLWFIPFGLLGMLFFSQPGYMHFGILIPAIGAMLGLSFSSMKNNSLAELLHLVLLACLFGILFYPF